MECLRVFTARLLLAHSSSQQMSLQDSNSPSSNHTLPIRPTRYLLHTKALSFIHLSDVDLTVSFLPHRLPLLPWLWFGVVVLDVLISMCFCVLFPMGVWIRIPLIVECRQDFVLEEFYDQAILSVPQTPMKLYVTFMSINVSCSNICQNLLQRKR